MLLLSLSVDVGGVAQLGLDLLLAVAEVVVGDDGDNDTTGVARCDLEGRAAVVEVVILLVVKTVGQLGKGEGGHTGCTASDRIDRQGAFGAGQEGKG